MMLKKTYFLTLLLSVVATSILAQQHPNVIYIYADDLGYGDLSSYGATKIRTPNVDRLSAQGIRFNNAHSTSATAHHQDMH